MRPISLLIVVTLLQAIAAKRIFRRPPPAIVFQFKDIYSCPDHDQNEKITLRYSRSGDVFADSEWDMINPATKISKLRQIMTSCREDGSFCEHFMTWNSPMDGCAFIAAKHAVWSPAFANIKPPFVCPLKAVHYVNLNWTIDKDLLLALPFPHNRVYKDRLEIWNEKDQLTFCFVLEMIWRDYKKKNASTPTTPPPGAVNRTMAIVPVDVGGSAVNTTTADENEELVIDT